MEPQRLESASLAELHASRLAGHPWSSGTLEKSSSARAASADGSQAGRDEAEGTRKTKARKPYTITKQRERWTDEEHARFLDALKLYGRAWRRIEEHIGTKTAVQIRSHAQKFFSKLEKEQAKAEGGNGDEISIPPPRPKRKPSHPYPRKTPSSDNGLAQARSMQAQSPEPVQRDPLGLATGVDRDVGDATVAAVAAAASAAAAAAAAAVVAAAGEHVQAKLQANPPRGFPFFGLPPSALAQLARQGANVQLAPTQQQELQAALNGTHLNSAGTGKISERQRERTATNEPTRQPCGHEHPSAVGGSDADSACSRERPPAGYHPQLPQFGSRLPPSLVEALDNATRTSWGLHQPLVSHNLSLPAPLHVPSVHSPSAHLLHSDPALQTLQQRQAAVLALQQQQAAAALKLGLNPGLNPPNPGIHSSIPAIPNVSSLGLGLHSAAAASAGGGGLHHQHIGLPTDRAYSAPAWQTATSEQQQGSSGLEGGVSSRGVKSACGGFAPPGSHAAAAAANLWNGQSHTASAMSPVAGVVLDQQGQGATAAAAVLAASLTQHNLSMLEASHRGVNHPSKMHVVKREQRDGSSGGSDNAEAKGSVTGAAQQKGPGLTLHQRSSLHPGVSPASAKATGMNVPTQPASGAAAGAAQTGTPCETAAATQQQRTGASAETHPAGPANPVEAAAAAAVAFMQPRQEQDMDMEREGSGNGSTGDGSNDKEGGGSGKGSNTIPAASGIVTTHTSSTPNLRELADMERAEGKACGSGGSGNGNVANAGTGDSNGTTSKRAETAADGEGEGSGGQGSGTRTGMGDGGDEGRSSCEPDPDRRGTASGQGFPSNVQPTNGPLTEAQALQAATVSALQHARVHPFYLQSSSLNSQLAHLQHQALVQWGANASPYEIQSLLGSMFGSMQAVASAHQHSQQQHHHQLVKPQPISSMPGLGRPASGHLSSETAIELTQVLSGSTAATLPSGSYATAAAAAAAAGVSRGITPFAFPVAQFGGRTSSEGLGLQSAGQYDKAGMDGQPSVAVTAGGAEVAGARMGSDQQPGHQRIATAVCANQSEAPRSVGFKPYRSQNLSSLAQSLSISVLTSGNGSSPASGSHGVGLSGVKHALSADPHRLTGPIRKRPCTEPGLV